MKIDPYLVVVDGPTINVFYNAPSSYSIGLGGDLSSGAHGIQVVFFRHHLLHHLRKMDHIDKFHSFFCSLITWQVAQWSQEAIELNRVWVGFWCSIGRFVTLSRELGVVVGGTWNFHATARLESKLSGVGLPQSVQLEQCYFPCRYRVPLFLGLACLKLK